MKGRFDRSADEDLFSTVYLQEQASAECRKLYKNMVTVSLATTSNKS